MRGRLTEFTHTGFSYGYDYVQVSSNFIIGIFHEDEGGMVEIFFYLAATLRPRFEV